MRRKISIHRKEARDTHPVAHTALNHRERSTVLKAAATKVHKPGLNTGRGGLRAAIMTDSASIADAMKAVTRTSALSSLVHVLSSVPETATVLVLKAAAMKAVTRTSALSSVVHVLSSAPVLALQVAAMKVVGRSSALSTAVHVLSPAPETAPVLALKAAAMKAVTRNSALNSAVHVSPAPETALVLALKAAAMTGSARRAARSRAVHVLSPAPETALALALKAAAIKAGSRSRAVPVPKEDAVSNVARTMVLHKLLLKLTMNRNPAVITGNPVARLKEIPRQHPTQRFS